MLSNEVSGLSDKALETANDKKTSDEAHRGRYNSERDGEDAAEEPSKNPWFPSTDALLNALAHGLLTSVLLLVTVIGLVEFTGESATVRPWCYTGLIGFVAVLVSGTLFADRFNGIGYLKLAVGGGVVALADVLFLALLPSVRSFFAGAIDLMVAVCALVAGVAVGLLMLARGSIDRCASSVDAFTSSATSFFVTGVFLIIAMAADDTFKLIDCAVYLGLSLVVVLAQGRDAGSSDTLTRAESLERLKLDKRSSLSYAFTGIAIGLLFIIIWWQFPRVQAGIVSGGSFIVASVVVYAVSHYRGASWVLLGPIERWTFPFIIFCLLLLIFMGVKAPGAPIVTMVLLFILMIRDLSRVITRALLMVEHQVQSLYLYARATMPFGIGLAAGCLIGVVSATVGEFGMSYVFGLLVILFSIGVTIVPYGEDPLVMPEAAATSKAPSADVDGASFRHTWRKACDQVCEEHGLTPREREVFRMLTRGRTAKVIARDLDISVYTVKSHTYNIYRKLNVESQQELIDMVVATDGSIAEYMSQPKERIAADED